MPANGAVEVEAEARGNSGAGSDGSICTVLPHPVAATQEQASATMVEDYII